MECPFHIGKPFCNEHIRRCDLPRWISAGLGILDAGCNSHIFFPAGCKNTSWWRTCSREMTDQGNNNQNISKNPFAALFSSLADAKQFASGQKQRRQTEQQCKVLVISTALPLYLRENINLIVAIIHPYSCRFGREPVWVRQFCVWQHRWKWWLSGRDQPIFPLKTGALRAAQRQPHDPEDLPHHSGQQWVLNIYPLWELPVPFSKHFL